MATTPGRTVSRFGIPGLVVIQAGIWLVAGWIVWSFRSLMVESSSPQSAANAREAVLILVWCGINVLVLLPFLARRGGGWGWYLLLAVQVIDLVVATGAAVSINAWWWTISAVAAATVAVIIVNRRAAQRSA